MVFWIGSRLITLAVVGGIAVMALVAAAIAITNASHKRKRGRRIVASLALQLTAVAAIALGLSALFLVFFQDWLALYTGSP